MPDQPTNPTEDELACIQVVEMVTDYLEGALPRAEARLLERHLETCPLCTEYLEQMRELDGSLQGLDDVTIPAETRDDLLAAFREIRKRSDP